MRVFGSVVLVVVASFAVASAHVGLDYPSGGESFMVGQVVTVRWHIIIDHGDCVWDLFYSSDGGSNWQQVVVGIAKSQLQYNWTVPDPATNAGRIRIVQNNTSGMDYEDTSGAFTVTSTTGTNETGRVERSFRILPAYPNPFNPETNIRFEIPDRQFVSLRVYNLLGQVVKTLVDGVRPPGDYAVRFDASNLASGIYMYRLQSGNLVETRRLVLLR